MGCKFSFKRVFLVASLSLAGLFGISSIFTDKLTSSSYKEANATTSGNAIYETVAGVRYRVIYFYESTAWEIDKSYNKFYYDTNDDNAYKMCHCFRYIYGGIPYINFYGRNCITGEDDGTWTFTAWDDVDGKLNSFSEIIGDRAAKIYLPHDVDNICFQSSQYLDDGKVSGYNDQRRTGAISLLSTDEAFVITSNRWNVYPGGDAGVQTATRYTKEAFLNLFYTNYFTKSVDWIKVGLVGLFVRCEWSGGGGTDRTGNPITSSMLGTFSTGRQYAKFLVPKSTTTLLMADNYDERGNNSYTGTKYTTVYDNYVYCVNATTGSPCDASYTPFPYHAEYTGKVRLYAYINWGKSTGDDKVVSGPFVDYEFPSNKTGFRYEMQTSISADTANCIPASGTAVETFEKVADVPLSDNGKEGIYFTFFKNEGRDPWSRFVPYLNGSSQKKGETGGFENPILQDTSKTYFQNGYIYYVYDFESTGSEYQAWWGYHDTYDDNGSRYIKWVNYKFSCVGVFVHYDLNGGSFASNSTPRDVEAKFTTPITLPTAPTKDGYEFMGWEASSDGIAYKANSSFTATQPTTFVAKWASKTIQCVSSDKVRLWVGYANSSEGASTLMYNGFGNHTRLWIHQGDGSVGTEDFMYTPTGTLYSNMEVAAAGAALTDSVRRFDYFDIPISHFKDQYYLNIIRYLANGSTDKYTSGEKTGQDIKTDQIRLSDSNNQAFKVLYVGVTWEFAPQFHPLTTNMTNGLFAAYALAGMHTCSSEVLNGYGGYSNWESVFFQNLGSADLAPYTIVDYDLGSEYEDDYEKNTTVNAAIKYLRARSEYNSHVANPNPVGLGRFSGLVSKDQTDTSYIIIIIASSISVLSITALSVLLVKKRKSQR